MLLGSDGIGGIYFDDVQLARSIGIVGLIAILFVFPSQLGDVAWSGLALTAVLLFLARPLAVVVALTPFAYRLREQIFLSWAGLRGAVPIVLATFALSSKVQGSATIFNAVFFVVLVSTLAQGMTLEPFARRLGLVTEEQPYDRRAK
jgi:cell volume regulation protein A